MSEVIQAACLAVGMEVVEAVVGRRIAVDRLPVIEVRGEVLLDVQLLPAHSDIPSR